MISLQNVVKKFGNTIAVDHVSLDVNEGETVVLLGTSGCGKTTTLRMINRLTETSAGAIYLKQKNIKDIPPEVLRKSMGYVLQHIGLFPHYTIAQNISVVPELLKWPKQKTGERIRQLMEQLNLPTTYLHLYPQQLSGGQQQRVGLARALAADPPILLMDEPFGALDAITRRDITKEFLKLEALKDKTIILVTHDIHEAFEMGDRILLMDQGRIVQQGSAVDLLFRPANHFVADFFSSQKMQLELRAILLKDILPVLPVSREMVDHTAIRIDENRSLWEALEMLTIEKDKTLLIRDSSSGEERLLQYDSLFAGLETIKQKRYE